VSKTVVSYIRVPTSGKVGAVWAFEAQREANARLAKDQDLCCYSCTPSLSLHQYGFGSIDRRV
jgi:hypothetical protein